MRFEVIAIAALAGAAPLLDLTADQTSAISSKDRSILQVALFLEHLEFALFTEGCQYYSEADFTNAGYYSDVHSTLCTMAGQEAIHAGTISEILQSCDIPTVQPCLYNFPARSLSSFMDQTQVITYLSVASYIGIAEQMSSNSTLLHMIAASILAVEARHDAFFRASYGDNTAPAVFDSGVNWIWAWNIAQPFVARCPVDLNIPLYPQFKAVAPYWRDSILPADPNGVELALSWNATELPVEPFDPLYLAYVSQNMTKPCFLPIFTTPANASVQTGTANLPAEHSKGVLYACLTTASGGLTLDELAEQGTLAGPVQIMLS